jgi:predicted nucleic acid-binding protein
MRVLRYPRFKERYGYADEDLLRYRQFLESVAYIVLLSPAYYAPLRDLSDLAILQTADVGQAELLVTADPDFYEAPVLRYCEARRIDVCTEAMALRRLL